MPATLRSIRYFIFMAEFRTALLKSTPANINQLTSKSTGVTLSLFDGTITMNSAALAGGATVSFTLTNTKLLATDVLDLSYASGTVGAYQISAVSSAGSALFSVKNITSGSLSEAIVITFATNRSAIGGFTGDFFQLLAGDNTIIFDGTSAGS